MGIETAITKIGGKIFAQAKRACGNPVCKARTLKSMELKPLAEDIVTMGNKTKILESSIATVPSHLISGQEFEKQMLSLSFGSTQAKEGFIESAKMAEGLYDKTYIDTYKAIQKYAERDGDFILDYDGIPKIIDFLRTKEGLNLNLQNKIIEFLKTCPEEYSQSLVNMCKYKNNSLLIKEKVLDLNVKIHNKFEDIPCPDNENFFGDGFTEALVKYVNPKLPEKEMLRRIEKLSYISENSAKISPFSDLVMSTSRVEEEFRSVQDKLVQKFLNRNILPTEHAVEQITRGSLESREHFFAIMKPLTNLKAKGIKVDEYAIEKILKNEDKTVLNNIIKFLKSNKNYKKSRVSISENSLNPNEYEIRFVDNKTSKTFMFNKKTNKITSTMEDNIERGSSLSITSEDFALKRKVNDLNIRNDGRVIDETVIQKTKTGVQKYTEYTKESPMGGQFDVYRILPNGKVKVLAKSFRDPITGESIVRRNFVSPNVTKVAYNYNADKIGNYDFNYVIRDRSGKVIMNQRQVQKVLGSNHYLSIINGQKYEVKLNKHILTVTPEGQNPIKLDLDEIVKVDNPKIFDTIAQLPANEILNIKRFNVKFVKSREELDAAYMGKEFLGDHRLIRIGSNTADSRFAILHELGHLKEARISDSDYKKILKVYKQEVDKIRKTTTKSEQELMSYLIDTDHYLNAGRGAIQELVADVNAQKSVITDMHLGDVGIRTIKTQEYLPETLATISEILEKI